MEYRLTKKELGNDALYDTLVSLHSNLCAIGHRLYVVGACARDIAMKIMGLDASTRRTRDLDIAVKLENWEAFDILVNRLQTTGFERYNNTQKFFYKDCCEKFDYEVDIVPFGNIAEGDVVKWAPDGNPELSVRCFADVMAHAVKVTLNDVVPIFIAPMAGQFLIKLDAWNNRHLETDKDAIDMYVMIDRYYDYLLESHPERFAEIDTDIITDSSSIADIGAYFLASDAVALLSTLNLKFYAQLISKELELEESSDLIYHFTKLTSGEEQQRYNFSRNIWSVVQNVLYKELRARI